MKKIFYTYRKGTALLSLWLVATALAAQTSGFGKHHAEKKRQRLELCRNARGNLTATAQARPNIDEYSEQKGSSRFRYVFAYNKDGVRSSETIFIQEKNQDGTWGQEALCDVGRYTYEYDSKSRVKVKDVQYEKAERFTSYRIMVNYSDNETEYVRYEYWGTDLHKTEAWTRRADGSLSSHSYYDPYGGELEKWTSFNQTGDVNGQGNRYQKKTLAGELNDSIITGYSNDYSGNNAFVEDYTEHYAYRPDRRITEYSFLGQDNFSTKDNMLVIKSYDSFGRLLSDKQYCSAYDDADNEEATTGAKTTMLKTPDNNVWTLKYSTTYTYFNDEVYGIGNSWHDVFDFEGPVATVSYWEKEDYMTDAWTQEIKCERDADGKLLRIVCNESDGTAPSVTVDAAGHIVRISDGENMYTDYTWNGERIIKETSADGGWTLETTYTYGNNQCRKTYRENGDTEYSAMEEISENDVRTVHRLTTYQGSWQDNYRCICERQTHDVSFVRESVFSDVDGFTPDSTVVVSVADRIVVATNTNDYGWLPESYSYWVDELPYYANIAEEAYFHVTQNGTTYYCHNFDDRLQFVVDNGRLLREYIYYDEYNVSPGLPSENAAKADAPAEDEVESGIAYDRIDYIYAANGLMTGKRVTSVDENGTTTEVSDFEYKYDETSGIGATISADRHLSLHGRTIGLGEGHTFSVYTHDGKCVCTGVESCTLTAPGIYVVHASGVKMKVIVR